jgi:hypothetical protein
MATQCHAPQTRRSVAGGVCGKNLAAPDTVLPYRLFSPLSLG